MKILSILFLIQACISLSACSNLQKHTQESIADKQQPITHATQPRSKRSLYLASQAAMRAGQTQLAMQFLTALLQQSSPADRADMLVPTLQLSNLLLRSNHFDKALQHLQPYIQTNPINNHNTAVQKDLYLMYARSLAGTQKYNDALDTLTSVLNQHPDFTTARHLQITLFTQTQQYDLAHIVLNTAIKQHDSPILRQFEADVFAREGKFKRAVKSLQTMHNLNPSNDAAILLLSQLYLQQQQADKAEQTLRSISKPSLRIQHALARLLIQQQRPKEAITIYQNMMQQLPDNAEISSALGLLYYQLHEFQDAVKQFNIALQQQENNQNYQFYLASSLEALQKNDAARTLYQKIELQHNLWEEAQLRIARIDYTEKKYHDSLRYVQSVIDKKPDHPQAWVLLSSIYLAQKDYQAVLDKTSSASKLKKIPARLSMNRAIAFEHFKRYNDVEQTLKLLLKGEPEHAEALNFLAYTYAEQGIKLDEAESYIQQALILQPNDGYYLDTLAWIYYKRGDFGKAIQSQEKALKIINNDTTMQEHLGDMLWRQGNTKKAIQAWRSALNLKPEKPNSLQHKIKHGL